MLRLAKALRQSLLKTQGRSISTSKVTLTESEMKEYSVLAYYYLLMREKSKKITNIKSNYTFFESELETIIEL